MTTPVLVPGRAAQDAVKARGRSDAFPTAYRYVSAVHFINADANG
jgi:hypothetical protein